MAEKEIVPIKERPEFRKLSFENFVNVVHNLKKYFELEKFEEIDKAWIETRLTQLYNNFGIVDDIMRKKIAEFTYPTMKNNDDCREILLTVLAYIEERNLTDENIFLQNLEKYPKYNPLLNK